MNQSASESSVEVGKWVSGLSRLQEAQGVVNSIDTRILVISLHDSLICWLTMTILRLSFTEASARETLWAVLYGLRLITRVKGILIL